MTVTVAGASYALLLLHVASGNDPRGLGLRDDMLLRACEFRKVLDKVPASNGQANYIFLGDFNLMGMTYMFVRDRDISPANELVRLENEAARHAMRILPRRARHLVERINVVYPAVEPRLRRWPPTISSSRSSRVSR